MTHHPYRDVAIVGVHNTPQARELPDHDSSSIALDGVTGALADAGIALTEVDGVVGEFAHDWVLELGLGPCSRRSSRFGIPMLLDAAAMVASGECEVVVVGAGGAGTYTERAATAPWTRPANELVVGFGLFTAAEFALMARRHMLTYGTTPEQMATVAATIRNNGHVNPEAVYFGRGPFTPDDILASRMIADPFHLLDCAMTSEGGCGIVLTTAERAADAAAANRRASSAAAGDDYGPAYTVPPVWDLRGRAADDIAGRLRRPAGGAAGVRHGRARARRRRRVRALRPVLVRDHPPARGVRVLRRGGGRRLRRGRPHRPGRPAARSPPTAARCRSATPGSTCRCCSGSSAASQQVRGTCATQQVAGAEVALCTNGGSGALFTDVMLIGSGRP